MNLWKFPTESREFEFAFASQPEIARDRQTILSATISSTLLTGTGTLTVGTPRVSGSSVFAQLSGGTEAALWELECSATTDAGDVLCILGNLLLTRA